MKKQILINVEAGERRIAIVVENRLDDYFVERLEQKNIVGNIYKGEVSSVVPGIGAAFINYGEAKNGFLYVSDAAEAMPDYDEGEIIYDVEASPPPDKAKRKGPLKIEDLLKKGQEIIIQAVKEEIGTKGARLTTNISMPGRYLVFMPYSGKIGISRKIRDEGERRRIKEILRSFKLPPGAGAIVRTAALGCDKKDLVRDIKYLTKRWSQVRTASQRKKAPALIWQELDIASKVIRDMLTEEVEKIIVDERGEFKRIKRIISNFSPNFRSRLELYKDDEPLFERYGVEKEIDKIFNRKIFLKCGGYITIEQTEGMVAIDVNSGRFVKKKDPEETIYRVNMEAAQDIARQLRLRDLGGIIVIDFIDMMKEQHRRNLMDTLQQEIKKDKARTHIASFSDLCIVEMTRQRTSKSLESAAYESCPYCNGRGLIQSKDTISIQAIRKLKDFLKKAKTKGDVEIVLHPDVAEKLRKDESGFLYRLGRGFRTKIIVLENSRLHIEDIEIKSV
jgi:ribonuclease G